jgi:hypothetical protein
MRWARAARRKGPVAVMAAIMMTLCAVTAAARAETVSVGGVLLRLSPPPDFCALDATHAADARLFDAVARTLADMGNHLLSLSADCTELAEWRSGKRELLDNLAQHQTMTTWEDVLLVVSPQTIIKQTCAEMRSRGGELVSSTTSQANARIEQVLKTVKINEMKFLGVLGEEPLACYAALLQRTATEAGREKTQVTVLATTVVRRKLIYYYRSAPFADNRTIEAMLERVTADTRRLHAENSE